MLIQEGEIDPEMARQAQLLLHSEYGRSEIAAYVGQVLNFLCGCPGIPPDLLVDLIQKFMLNIVVALLDPEYLVPAANQYAAGQYGSCLPLR